MMILDSAEALFSWHQNRKGTWAFVPTMGNLHEGHLNLVREAKKYAEKVVVSIYVNPTQFGQNEDFGAYPRTIDADKALLNEVGADALFLPTEKLIYPFGTAEALSYALPQQYTNILCGVSRPTHFQGVMNVVSRLFNLIRPHFALFGAKDYQQQWLIKRFVADFHLPIQVITVPTVRADDGLALSSRNGYLSSEERQIAPKIYQSLNRVREALLANQNIISQEIKYLNDLGIQVEYYELRHNDDLSLTHQAENAVLFFAGKLGKTRLIDNLPII